MPSPSPVHKAGCNRHHLRDALIFNVQKRPPLKSYKTPGSRTRPTVIHEATVWNSTCGQQAKCPGLAMRCLFAFAQIVIEHGSGAMVVQSGSPLKLKHSDFIPLLCHEAPAHLRHSRPTRTRERVSLSNHLRPRKRDAGQPSPHQTRITFPTSHGGNLPRRAPINQSPLGVVRSTADRLGR